LLSKAHFFCKYKEPANKNNYNQAISSNGDRKPAREIKTTKAKNGTVARTYKNVLVELTNLLTSIFACLNLTLYYSRL